MPICPSPTKHQTPIGLNAANMYLEKEDMIYELSGYNLNVMLNKRLTWSIEVIMASWWSFIIIHVECLCSKTQM